MKVDITPEIEKLLGDWARKNGNILTGVGVGTEIKINKAYFDNGIIFFSFINMVKGKEIGFDTPANVCIVELMGFAYSVIKGYGTVEDRINDELANDMEVKDEELRMTNKN